MISRVRSSRQGRHRSKACAEIRVKLIGESIPEQWRRQIERDEARRALLKPKFYEKILDLAERFIADRLAVVQHGRPRSLPSPDGDSHRKLRRPVASWNLLGRPVNDSYRVSKKRRRREGMKLDQGSPSDASACGPRADDIIQAGLDPLINGLVKSAAPGESSESTVTTESNDALAPDMDVVGRRTERKPATNSRRPLCEGSLLWVASTG